MTRRTREPLHPWRAITTLAFAVSLLGLVVAWPSTVAAARIAQAYTPGVSAAALGGDLVVNSYGVAGLGLFQMTLDNGSSAAAVCIQADVSHSNAASYQPAAPANNSGALDYLTWRYLRGAALGDVQAAGLNLAAWALTGARRNVGGTIWQGGTLTVAVLGVGPRDDIESAAIAVLGESTRRRGPWTLTALPNSGTTVSVRLAGPGGPIANVPISFAIAAGARIDIVTGADGIAVFSPPDAAAGTTVHATTTGPGRSQEYAAAGSQRVAVAGVPAQLAVEIPLPTTSTTSTTSTSSTTTSTSSTTTTTSSTTTTASTTSPPSPSTPPASTSTSTTSTSTTSTSTTSTSTTTSTTPSTTVPRTTSTTTTTTEVDRPPPDASTSTTTSTTPSTTPSTTSPSTTSPSSTSPRTTTTVPDEPTVPADHAPPAPPDIPATGTSSRWVVRIGALLFALGSIATYVAAGTRRNPVRDVDVDGRDL